MVEEDMAPVEEEAPEEGTEPVFDREAAHAEAVAAAKAEIASE